MEQDVNSYMKVEVLIKLEKIGNLKQLFINQINKH